MDEDIIVGVHPVQEALVSGGRSVSEVRIRHGALSPGLARIAELAAERGVSVRRMDKVALDRQAGGQLHQGVLAIAGRLEAVPLERILSVPNPLVVVLDGVQDPQNLGSIIRTAEITGVSGVVVPDRRSAPLSAAVLRASAGAAEHVPVARVTNLVSAIKAMKAKGMWVVGVDLRASALWTDFDYTVPLALVFGAEHHGIRRLVREHCDAMVRLPTRGQVDSLNVSVAAGAVLYEVVRQRGLAAPG